MNIPKYHTIYCTKHGQVTGEYVGDFHSQFADGDYPIYQCPNFNCTEVHLGERLEDKVEDLPSD